MITSGGTILSFKTLNFMRTLIPGSIELFAANFVPRSFDRCNGQPLSIPVYQGLFSILGTRFGGDGRTNFDLPNVPDLKSANGAGIEYLIEVEGAIREGSSWTMGMGAGFVGEIVYTAADFAVSDFFACDGSSKNVSDYEELYGVIGNTFGGSGDTFNLPNIPPVKSEGSDGTLTAYIRATSLPGSGVTPTLSSIMLWGGDEVPKSTWQFCDGEEMSISQYPALFSLIGTIYGGDGRTNFMLPKLTDNSGARYIICIAGEYPARK